MFEEAVVHAAAEDVRRAGERRGNDFPLGSQRLPATSVSSA
jgi:hypothetical protein